MYRVPRKPLPNAAPRRKRTEKALPAKPLPGEARKRGRPCMMTAVTVAKFLAHIRDGVWRDDAEALVGLGRDVVDSWLKRGRREIAKRDESMQRDGTMPKLGKWGNFVIAVENAEASMIAECWGTLTEIRRARGPSPGLDADGNLIPGPLLHPEVASKNAMWQLTRKNNLRFGQGSQRTDLVRGGASGSGDGSDDDDVAAVMEALDRRIEKKIAERDNSERE